MKVSVKKDGLLIPKRLLKGVKQANVRKERGKIVVRPLPGAADPIFNLGKRPVKTGVADAAKQHDKYLYDRS